MVEHEDDVLTKTMSNSLSAPKRRSSEKKVENAEIMEHHKFYG